MFKKFAFLAFILLSFFYYDLASAQDSAVNSQPIRSTADQVQMPSSNAFAIEPPTEPSSWNLKESLKDTPTFFKDMSAKINFRTYYFAQQDAADSPGQDKEKVSWAAGGSTQIKSGKLLDVFSVGSELFTSQKLYGPEDKDGARLLENDQESYTVLGVLNPKFDYEGHSVSLYRQRLDLPYVNNQDNRMTPNTFENYSYAFFGEGEKAPLKLAIGYLNKMKKRNSEDFVYMSEAAGVQGHDRGMPWFGARLRPIDEIKVSAVNYVGLDYLNIFYSDADYSLKLSKDWALKSSVQYSAQNSIGEDLLTGSNVSAAMWGVQQAVSYGRFMVRTAVTVDDKGNTMLTPYGSYPGYNSGIVDDFNQAGETAWKIGISYDFAGIGLDGLSAYSDFIQGSGAVDSSKQALPDQDETDVNIDYRMKDGFLNNFWLRLRGGFVHDDEVGTTTDYRVIVNYEVPII